jgi:hypothetical protein
MPKPCRNTSNTIPKVNNKTPDKTPIIPVTLITWPMMISLSVITDLHYRLSGVFAVGTRVTLRPHKVQLDLDSNLPLIYVDAVLVEQAFVQIATLNTGASAPKTCARSQTR